MLILLTGAIPSPASAQTDSLFALLSRINALRRQNGLAPLELQDQLTAAAQRHSQDMANTDTVSHTGSDGSTPEQRIRAAGYGPDPIAWGENIYGSGLATVDAAWQFWTTSTVHRNNLLSERYREIGIGVAPGSAGGSFFTLTFGARPGVLPFFVDQGSLLNTPSVTLTLSNEEAAPGGPGGAIARAVEVRVGEGEDLSAIAWQLWQRTISFTLSNSDGPHRITVEYRDARGITASYFRLVTLAVAPAQVSPTTTLEPAPAPTETPASTPAVHPIDTPFLSETPTRLPSATSTPSPSATSTAGLPTASSTSTAEPRVSILLTATIAGSPTPAPQVALAPTDAARPALGATPPADSPPLAVLVERGWSDAPRDIMGLLAGLQVVVAALAAWVILRRVNRS